MSANIIISNDSMNNSSRILAFKSNENGLSTIFSYNNFQNRERYHLCECYRNGEAV